MKVIQAIVHELISLFVDDWLFAVLVVGWIAGVGFLARQGGFARSSFAAPLLFCGIAVLTLAFVARKSRSLR